MLKDPVGNIIDGKHRLSTDPRWPSKTLPYKANSLKGVIAKGITNFSRRGIHINEYSQWLDELERAAKAETGRILTVAEIAEITGLNERKVRRYLPPAYKVGYRVKAGKPVRRKRRGRRILLPQWQQKQAWMIQQTPLWKIKHWGSNRTAVSSSSYLPAPL